VAAVKPVETAAILDRQLRCERNFLRNVLGVITMSVSKAPSESIAIEKGIPFTPTSPTGQMKSWNGILLVPQPSDDLRDPLVGDLDLIANDAWLTIANQNFPQWRKEAIFATITFAIFASTVSPLAGQLNLAAQAKLYHGKTTTQESYSVSCPHLRRV
jgi:hypothetical protein